jgi:serine/threonine protein kinase
VAGDALLGRELGRYRVESIIGSGGFATVYRAIDLALERPVALKVVDPTAHRNPTIARRFVLEGRAVASLDHPAVVPVFDAGENDGVLWLAMRLIAGGSLDDALVAGHRFRLEEVAAVATRIGGALDHAHGKGIVHRDVKPSNILLEDHVPARAWLADFGIAATTRTAGLYTTGALGTAAYMAPEQSKPSTVGPPADLYSLACVTYELLTRCRPFPGDDYVELLVAHATHPVPPTPWPRVDEYMQRALAKNPADRPPSGAAFADELRRVLMAVDSERDAARSTNPAAAPASPGPAEAAAVAASGATGAQTEAPTAAPARPPLPPPPTPPPGAKSPASTSPQEAPTVAEQAPQTLEHPGRPLPPPPPPGYQPSPGTAASHPGPSVPRDPTVARNSRRKGRRLLITGGVVIAVGAVVIVQALLQDRGPSTRQVNDPAGISYPLIEGWSTQVEAPTITLRSDGETAATITHVATTSGDAKFLLRESQPPVCEGQPEAGPDIVGATQTAQCENSSDGLPAIAVGAVAEGQFWVITVGPGVPAAERDELLSGIELRALGATP